jgi:hypothetical protein
MLNRNCGMDMEGSLTGYLLDNDTAERGVEGE